ncbi:MAG: ZIP family metal transporter [Flavobacteriales bacterium AspAUS03]
MIYLLLIFTVVVGVALAQMLSTCTRHPIFLLTFSSAYLLSTVFNHLFPEIYSKEPIGEKGLFILGGVFAQILLENITHGIEHGHLQHERRDRFPYGMFIGLCIHSLLEGAAILPGDHALLWAVIIHKIPVTIILYIFLSKALQRKKKILILMLVFALSTPLGSLLVNISFFTQYHDHILALVSGIFIHIATVILFESSDGHRLNLTKLLFFLLGVVFSYVFLP